MIASSIRSECNKLMTILQLYKRILILKLWIATLHVNYTGPLFSVSNRFL